MKLSERVAVRTKPVVPDFKATTVHLDRVVTKVQQKYGLGEKADNQNELEEKLADFQKRLKRNDWSRFPWHMASDVLRSLMISDMRDDPQWSDVSKVLLDTLESTSRKGYCRAALDAYIETAKEVSPTLHRLRGILARKSANDIPLRRNLIEDLRFFKPALAPKLIASEISKDDRPYELVKSWGIWSPHASGLFEDVFDQMVASTSKERQALDRVPFERIMNWLCPNSSTTAEATRAAGIDALILPFADKENSDLRDDVERFLVRNFGDPRVAPARWAGVSDKAKSIMYRWMTSKSLKMFFDIINEFEGSHMWKPRREFWTEIDQRNWISDAWVVLNENGARYARHLAREHDDKSFLSHGRLDFYEREKCFFIMRVGDLTIVEGTHSFKVRIFGRDAENAPLLHKNFYRRSAIYARPAVSGVEYTHDQFGNWMQKSDDYMRRNR